jgi:hypothetical protein
MPHDLSEPERDLLDLLLMRDFAGRDELRAQAANVQTTGRSCTCGCPSFSLIADRAHPPAPAAEYMVSDAHGADPHGHLVGVLLFAKDGYLSEVEVYSVAGDDISDLPRPADLSLSEWSDPPDGRTTRHLLNP